jgi:hypothetical protein
MEIQSEEECLGNEEDAYTCDEDGILGSKDVSVYTTRRYIPSKKDGLYPPSNKLNSILPKCYKDIKFPSPKIDLLHEETLFYIFYCIPNEEIQAEAFKALTLKRYFFHVQMNSFVVFAGEAVPDGSKRQITYFDPEIWEKFCKEVTFDQEFVDNLRQ